MATAAAVLKPHVWDINDLFKVCVYNVCPQNTDSNVVLLCYVTDRLFDFKSERRSAILTVLFPVHSYGQTDSTNMLKDNFRRALKEFVKCDKTEIAVSIDNLRTWSKEKFCQVLLSEFLEYARSSSRRQSGRVTLAFCATESRGFEKACEACRQLEVNAATQSGHNFGSGRRSKMSGVLPVSITVEKGYLDTTKADALACTMSSDLDLNRGIVTRALLAKCGKELQINLDKKCPNGHLGYGRVVAVPAPKLDCRCVLFGVMCAFDENYARIYGSPVEYYRVTVHDFVKACLEYAERNKFASIAFPAVGTGILRFPLDVVADEMFDTVINWSKDFGSVWLKDVRFVIYPKDMVVLKAFQEAEERYGTNTRMEQMKTRKSESKSPAAQQRRKVNTIPIPIGYTAELVQLCCQETIKYLKDSGCEVDFKDDKMILKSPDDISEKMNVKMQNELKKVEKAFPARDIIDLSHSDCNTSDFRRYLEAIKSGINVECFVDTVKKKVAVFGKDLKELAEVKDKIGQFFLPDRKRNETDNSRDVQQKSSAGGSSCGSRQRTSLSNSSQVKPVVAVFETKEKITVKVYSANILSVPVDCIVNGANVNLEHGGGIAKAIAASAGKELTNESHEILIKCGKLKVGEACSTSSGRLEYKCVVHTVGPCWNDYRPYTQTDVEKCEMDLYHAVLNSLMEAEKKNMQTIAVSSISSGKYGCPLDLCSVQYARAVTDYSKLTRHPLKEIHFVDTNMEMVQIMQETFHSMIPDGKVPKFYNKLAYMKSLGSEDSVPGKRVFKETNDSGRQKDSRKDQKKSGHSSPSFRGSDLTAYPYWCQDYLPGQKQKTFACFLGPYQKLYVYSTDILSMTGIDIIVCSNIPDGNTKGSLANAILSKGGVAYKRGKEEAFKKKATVGSIVACPAGNLRFKWVVHAILFNKKDIKDEKEREWNVKSIFRDIFSMLRKKGCDSMALPLIETGFGKADPVYYAERCIDGLLDFCSFNKDYPFNIHIVHNEEEKTEIVKKTVERVVCNATPLLGQLNQYKPKKKPLTDQPKRPSFQHSYHENHGSSYGRNNSKRYEMHNNTSTKHEEHPKVGKMYTLENTDLSVSNPRVSENGSEKADVTETQNMVEKFQENDVSGSDTDEDDEFCNTTNQNEASYAKLPRGNLPIYSSDDSDDQLSNDEGKTEISEEEKEEDIDKEGLETEANEEKVDEEEEEHEDEKETCVICMDEITDPRALPCGHVFCEDCIEAHFTYKEVYPTCGKVCGIITGDQPYGTMDVYTNEKASCAGFGSFGRIEITYNFPDGKQGPDHPSPGTSYKGITRKAYLPNNSRGKQICAMLRVAFERKLVFTIGRSRTTGADGVITWNNINHKTDPRPKSWFGYPDPSYLDRVTEDLEIKGVTINDIPALSVMKSRHR